MSNLEMKSLRDIEYIAGGLLSQGANPVRKFRILRDIFRLPAGDRSILAAKAEMLQSKWVLKLKLEMNERIMPEAFSPDVQLNTPSLCELEKAVSRGLNLGLDRNDDILAEAAAKLSYALSESLLQAGGGIADRWGWPAVHAAGSLLAQIDPWNASLDSLWANWYQVAENAFASSRYRQVDETAEIRNRFPTDDGAPQLSLNSKQAIEILSSRSKKLPKMLEALLHNHIWFCDSCMGYPGMNMSNPSTGPAQPDLEVWLRCLEILSGFQHGLEYAEPAVSVLWDARGADGLWGCWTDPQWMLSDSWLDDKDRKADQTVRILIYLRKNWL